MNMFKMIDAAHSMSLIEAIHEVLLSVQTKVEENCEEVSFNDAVSTQIVRGLRCTEISTQ